MKTSLKLLMMGAASVALGLLAGCASSPKQNSMAFATEALTATDAGKVKLSGLDEEKILSRFEKFSGDISAANITNNIGEVYAANVYFRDPFKEIHGVPDFEAYLLRDSAAVAQYTIDWQDVGKSAGDYYFRWVMTVKLKRDSQSKPPTQTCGVSDVRFGADGKVIYEQDYFDAAAFLYEQIPILGGEIRFIKKRL